MMAKVVKSPSKSALLRGDKSLKSALVYMSKEAILEEIQKGLQEMYKESINTNNNMDEEILNLSQQFNDRLIESIIGEEAANFG